MNKQYANELTPEIKAKLETSSFTAEEIGAMDDEARAIIAEGSITRRGGIVAPIERKSKLLLDNSRYASMYKGAGVALVGSLLDNGDEIISTPQGHTYLVTREGIVSGADFLTITGA
ncbi:TPA: hypothetical protein QCJ61_003708 [Enterobacter asburiae]|uniref:hypothetical protein n=1 Tax=Enterobacter sp. C4G1 TaxID=3458724 RepID=UPI0032FB7E6E|nr:hypothetical protein [Enterobacter asburiae]HDR2805679.1 hypothetical protein [Enterobacter asburiae]HDR2811249.1 hypothetical protein [Enterobacter asburiae]HDR2816686.1 hypothetical protein [Enterobacter asburiae]